MGKDKHVLSTSLILHSFVATGISIKMFPLGNLAEQSIVRYNLILGFGAVSAAALIIYNVYKRYQRNGSLSCVRNWKPVGTVSGLNIYPIKSCHRIDVEEADCGKLGIYNEEFRDRFRDSQTLKLFKLFVVVNISF